MTARATLEDIKRAREAMEKVNKEWKDSTPTIMDTRKAERRVKQIKKNLKEIEKGVEDFSEKRGSSYARDIEHNINEWCSIWEDSNKAKAYRKQWNDIYSKMARWWED